MKISKSILEAALGLVSQKIAPHSPQGNYVTVNESKEAEGHLWQAGEHKKTPQDKEHEAWERKYNVNRVNESEKYTDEHGVTWNDEGDSDHGHTNWGRGPMNHYGARRYRSGYRKPAAQKPAAQKHYHSVPYKDKEHAKGEGMKWDGDKRKWYHTDAGKSATSKFRKLTEEELTEAKLPLETYRLIHRDEHERARMVKDTDHYAAHGGSGPINAVGTAKRHFKKLGYKVHDAEHVGEVKEDLDEDAYLYEEHATREQAEKRMAEVEKKHPMAKHTVMQGRRSGKWHVVRHTGGGMHVVESADDVVEDCGLESKADFDSKKKKAAIVKSTVKQKKETK